MPVLLKIRRINTAEFINDGSSKNNVTKKFQRQIIYTFFPINLLISKCKVIAGELPSTSGGAASRKDKEHRPVPVFQTRSDAVDKKSKQGVKPSANGNSRLRESFVDSIQNVAVPSTDRLGRRRVSETNFLTLLFLRKLEQKMTIRFGEP